MTLVSGLVSTAIVTSPPNRWKNGNANASMELIVEDVEAIAAAVDAINSGTVTLTDVTVANGTAAAPTVNFAGSTTTGLYRSAANEVGITTGGTGQVIFADGAIKPVTDNDIDLGTGSLEFKDLYIDGTANIDSLVADTADINGGTVDAATIGGATPAAGTFTTAAATTFDTNVAAAGVTLAGTTLAADGTDANIDITVTPKGTGGLVLPSGAVTTPSIQIGTETDGFYRVGVNQLGVSINNDLATVFKTTGVTTENVIARVNQGTPGTNVTAVEYGDGKDITTVLTLTAVDLGAPTAGGNSAHGALVYTFPAGRHVHMVSSFNIGLTIGGVTTDTPDVGIGSVIGVGAVATLDGTPTFEDYVTGQTWDVALDGTLKAAGPLGATAGVLTGISLNTASSTKAVHLNAADGWNAGVTGNLTATGTIVLKWTVM